MKKMFVTLAALALAATALAVPAAAHGHGGWNGECRQAVSCLDADGTHTDREIRLLSTR